MKEYVVDEVYNFAHCTTIKDLMVSIFVYLTVCVYQALVPWVPSGCAGWLDDRRAKPG